MSDKILHSFATTGYLCQTIKARSTEDVPKNLYSGFVRFLKWQVGVVEIYSSAEQDQRIQSFSSRHAHNSQSNIPLIQLCNGGLNIVLLYLEGILTIGEEDGFARPTSFFTKLLILHVRSNNDAVQD